jgi:hypothetical protein
MEILANVVVHVAGMRRCLSTTATNGPIIHPPDDILGVESHDGMILTDENEITWRKTCPSATMSTTNPTWTDTNT